MKKFHIVLMAVCVVACLSGTFFLGYFSGQKRLCEESGGEIIGNMDCIDKESLNYCWLTVNDGGIVVGHGVIKPLTGFQIRNENMTQLDVDCANRNAVLTIPRMLPAGH